jgi:putative multiple sugar transport system substrate-binding protein
MVLSIGEVVRDSARLDAHVGFDAFGAGETQATMLLDGLGLSERPGSAEADSAGHGPFRIELVAGSPEDPDTGPAYQGAMSVLKPFLDAGTLVIGSGETALDDVTTLRGNAATASSRVTRILHDAYAGGFPDAVLATSDELARGVAAALLDAGAIPGDGFPVITGRGCQLRSLAALVDGRQYSSLLEDPRSLASAALAYIISERVAAGGGSVVTGGRTIDNGAAQIPAALVTGDAVRVDDIDAVVVASGYWSRSRVDEAIAEFGLPTP